MKAKLMSCGEEKQVVCQPPQNILALITAKKSLASNLNT